MGSLHPKSKTVLTVLTHSSVHCFLLQDFESLESISNNVAEYLVLEVRYIA